MSADIIWKKRGVLIKYPEVISFSDILDVGEQELSNPQYDMCVYEISDFSKTEEVKLNEEDIKIIAAWDKSALNFVKIKYSIIIGRKEEFFSLIGTYMNAMSELGVITIHVSNYEEAVAFLTGKGVDIS